jgi:hypothetical protein
VAVVVLAFAQALLGDELFRGLDAGAEHPGDPARIVAHRAVAEREVRLLRIAVPVHGEGDVVHVGRLAGVGAGEDRLDLVPDLVPQLVERPPERARMARAAHLGVAVVVERRALLSPDDQHRLARAQRHAHQGLERLRPGFRVAERRVGPVVLAHQRAALAPAGEEAGAAPGMLVH